MSTFTKIGTTIGVIASLATVIGFISVKPLPKISADGGLDWCNWSSKEQKFVEQLVDSRGQIAMVSFRIDADLQRSEESQDENDEILSEVEIETEEEQEQEQEACKYLNVSGDEIYENTPLTNSNSVKFFELPASLSSQENDEDHDVLISETTDEGEFISYKVSPNLVLPNDDVLFVNIETCESHCYSLKGPVFVREVYNSEGQLGIGLIPIDIHKNSYITSRFECRQEVDRSRFPFWGWIKCIL